VPSECCMKKPEGAVGGSLRLREDTLLVLVRRRTAPVHRAPLSTFLECLTATEVSRITGRENYRYYKLAQMGPLFFGKGALTYLQVLFAHSTVLPAWKGARSCAHKCECQHEKKSAH